MPNPGYVVLRVVRGDDHESDDAWEIVIPIPATMATEAAIEKAAASMIGQLASSAFQHTPRRHNG